MNFYMKKPCYHFTKNIFLQSILDNGLQPNCGTNCSLIGDKGKKVSYSVGTEGAIKMFTSLYEMYLRGKEYGFVIEDDEHQKMWDELRATENFEDWEEEGVYLVFDGNKITDSKNETEQHDASKQQTIPPNQLKVCVIRKKPEGEVFSYSKFDIARFWLAKSKKKHICFYKYHKEDRIEELKKDEYYMDYIDLDKFCYKYFGLQKNLTEQNKNKIERIKAFFQGIFKEI